MDTSKLIQLGITAAAVWAAWKYGNGFVKTAAAGVAGYVVANQVPLVRDGVNTRLVA